MSGQPLYSVIETRLIIIRHDVKKRWAAVENGCYFGLSDYFPFQMWIHVFGSEFVFFGTLSRVFGHLKWRPYLPLDRIQRNDRIMMIMYRVSCLFSFFFICHRVVLFYFRTNKKREGVYRYMKKRGVTTVFSFFLLLLLLGQNKRSWTSGPLCQRLTRARSKWIDPISFCFTCLDISWRRREWGGTRKHKSEGLSLLSVNRIVFSSVDFHSIPLFCVNSDQVFSLRWTNHKYSMFFLFSSNPIDVGIR